MKADLRNLLKTGLTCPPDRTRIEYVDSGPGCIPGLLIEARAAARDPGVGVWYFRARSRESRTMSTVRLGNTRDLGLQEAREQARKLRAEIELGRNPAAEAKARKAVLTLTAFFDEHYWPHIQLRKRSAKRDKELFKRCREKFGHLRLNEITRHEVQAFLTALRSEGLAPATCDHHVKLIRQMLNLAVEWGLLEKNPASRLRLFNADNKVEHLLNDQQLSDLLGVLRTDPNRTVCNVALFLLSTGARLNEALTAKWSHIDRAGRTWRIEALRSKSGRARSVPLNSAAMEVLDSLDTEGKFEHLWVNKRRSAKEDAEQPRKTLTKTWGRIRKKAALPHLRIHDLRHLYASFLVSSGRTLYEVQQILGHSAPTVTMRYAHLSTKALQDAANAASVAILKKHQSEKPPARDTGSEGGAETEPEAA